jgi:hypothetical protein
LCRKATPPEKLLGDSLKKLPHVTGSSPSRRSFGPEIPPEFLGQSGDLALLLRKLQPIIVYTNTADEGEAAFSTVKQVRETAMLLRRSLVTARA